MSSRYQLSPDGRLLQTIGFTEIEDSYESFGAYNSIYDFPGSNALNYDEIDFDNVFNASHGLHKTFAV